MSLYVEPNFKTKKALKEAVSLGKQVSFFQPGPFGDIPILDGEYGAEGPHYPLPHKWYAVLTIKDGKIVKVK